MLLFAGNRLLLWLSMRSVFDTATKSPATGPKATAWASGLGSTIYCLNTIAVVVMAVFLLDEPLTGLKLTGVAAVILLFERNLEHAEARKYSSSFSALWYSPRFCARASESCRKWQRCAASI
jgi:hypothetical protein